MLMYDKIIKLIEKCDNLECLKYGSWNSPDEIYISLSSVKKLLRLIDKQIKDKS